MDYLLRFLMHGVTEDGEPVLQWAAVSLEGELGTKGQLWNTALQEAQALSARYDFQFTGVDEISLEEV